MFPGHYAPWLWSAYGFTGLVFLLNFLLARKALFRARRHARQKCQTGDRGT